MKKPVSRPNYLKTKHIQNMHQEEINHTQKPPYLGHRTTLCSIQ